MLYGKIENYFQEGYLIKPMILRRLGKRLKYKFNSCEKYEYDNKIYVARARVLVLVSARTCPSAYVSICFSTRTRNSYGCDKIKKNLRVIMKYFKIVDQI